MRIALRFLGVELLAIEASDDEQQGNEPGDCTSFPVGFTPSPGDQRWEQGVEA